MVNPENLETGLRTISAGIPYVQLLRTEAIGLPTLELVLCEPALLGIYMYPVLDYSAINRHRACNLGPSMARVQPV